MLCFVTPLINNIRQFVLKTNHCMLLAVQAADVVCGSLVNKLLPSDVWTTSSSCLSWLQNQMHNNNNNNKKIIGLIKNCTTS